MNTLTEHQMRDLAPSIFATAPKSDVSDRYEFVPTIDVIGMMGLQDWKPVMVQEMTAKIEANAGVQKHMVKFQHADLQMDGRAIQALMFNSHNRQCSYQFHVGVLEYVCFNEMVVGDIFGTIRLKHINIKSEDVINACSEIVDAAPRVTNRIETMQQIELSPDEKGVFAEAAKLVAFGEDHAANSVSAGRFLSPRHYGQDATNLWNTFNIIQENVTQGGIGYRNPANSRRRRMRTRAITALDRNLKVNKELWTLAEHMVSLKAA